MHYRLQLSTRLQLIAEASFQFLFVNSSHKSVSYITWHNKGTTIDNEVIWAQLPLGLFIQILI